MKTDDLIAMLATRAPAVSAHAALRRFAVALAGSLPIALLLMAVVLGVRHDLGEAIGLPMFWVKFGFPMLIGVAGLWVVERLARPGVQIRWRWALIALPVLGLWLLGGASWAMASPEERPAMVWGTTWRVCPLNILMISLPILGCALWALRGLAPTQPGLAGAGAGAMAGGAGAMVYALHCPEMAAPFLAVWYVVGMALPVIIGAVAGPRLLRW